MEMNGLNQVLPFADDVILLGESNYHKEITPNPFIRWQ
jgi:hypothetical protein